jgi:hypothetical protein
MTILDPAPGGMTMIVEIEEIDRTDEKVARADGVSARRATARPENALIIKTWIRCAALSAKPAR